MYENEFNYDEFNYDEYNDDFTAENKSFENNDRKNKNISKIIIVIIFLILLILILLISVKKCDNSKDNPISILKFDINEVQLKVGETKQINATLNASDGVIIWQTSNKDVAIVENGLIKAVGEGSTVIEGIYIDSEGNNHKEQCVVEVKPKDNNNTPIVDTEKPIITYKASNNNWTNKDVTISITAKDNKGIKSLQYTTNCTKNCKYTNVTSNTIKITQAGITNVYIVATDINGNSVTQAVKVMIDKQPPTANLNITTPIIYNNTGSVEVCATCDDKESGCTSNKLCQVYTQSKNNQSIEVTDKAGNKATSYEYNIIIDKDKPTCSLKVSTDGTITATYQDIGDSGISYYGFSSNYSGNNTASQKVEDGLVNYYVKDKAGNTNSCSLEVKKRYVNCKCPEGYSIISAYSTTMCLKLQGNAGWSDWDKDTQEKVNTCTTTCFNGGSSCVQCTKMVIGNNQYYVKTIWKRSQTVCPSGTINYSTYCYYERYKICQTQYYS